MKDLYATITEQSERQAASIIKHLKAAGINDWADIGKERLYVFRDKALDKLASSSARTIFASFKAFLTRHEESLDLPKGWRDILQAKYERAIRVYLNAGELERLERVAVLSIVEKTVLYDFLVSARTGMRISDALRITEENFVESPKGDITLDYVSQKTSVRAQVPVSQKTKDMILWAQLNGANDISLAYYNTVLRDLCRRAGISDTVKVFRAGKTETGEKWEFVSSHTARISFCTNLAIAGLGVLEISRLAGHSNTTQTEKYIQKFDIELNDAARAYLIS